MGDQETLLPVVERYVLLKKKKIYIYIYLWPLADIVQGYYLLMFNFLRGLSEALWNFLRGVWVSIDLLQFFWGVGPGVV